MSKLMPVCVLGSPPARGRRRSALVARRRRWWTGWGTMEDRLVARGRRLRRRAWGWGGADRSSTVCAWGTLSACCVPVRGGLRGGGGGANAGHSGVGWVGPRAVRVGGVGGSPPGSGRQVGEWKDPLVSRRRPEPAWLLVLNAMQMSGCWGLMR